MKALILTINISLKIVWLSFLIFSASISAEVYKWTDKNGNTHFGDRPNNPAQAEVVEIREQKTGIMIDTSAPAFVYSASSKRDVHPREAISSDHDCKWARDRLSETEALWKDFKKGGYKQSDKNSYIAQVNSYKRDIKRYC